ncbi:MAG: matrixin family metalloprotease [Deltaproteobacteria bacterium]|nr:matrixin family metalloprotease [Deltaproteobacteria bacterium]
MRCLKATLRLKAILAFVLAVSSWPGLASAYTCSRTELNSGPSLVWNTRTIPYFVGSSLLQSVLGQDEASTMEEVQLSFDAWASVDCSDIEFPFQGVREGLSAGFSERGGNTNVIVAVSTGWRHDADAIAVTTNAYDANTGIVADADIEVNAQHFTFVKAVEGCSPSSGYMDLRNTLTHEIGHVIGLDHPPRLRAYKAYTMYPSAPACETGKQSLEEDDILGLCTIYPANGATTPCFPATSARYIVTSSDDGFGGCSDLSDADAHVSAAPRSPVSALLQLSIFLGAAVGLGATRRRC